MWTRLSEVVGRGAAHVVMDGRQDRDWLAGHVDTGKDHRRLRDAGQTLVQLLWRQVGHRQVDQVLVLSTASATCIKCTFAAPGKVIAEVAFALKYGILTT